MSGTGAARGRPGIAVIGIATRFPQAGSLTEFRANLRAGRDSVRAMPPERREATCLDPGAEYPHQGYLDRIDLFDHEFFGLSRREAEVTDPQHRLALQLAQEALENAGYPASRMRDSRTAVVFSSPSNGYLPLVREYGTLSMIGNIPCGLPARVSHLFGFTGPCYGVDTGCNGSLVAVHQASRELRDGDADYALAGGVSLRHVVPPADTVGAFPGIASPTAKCRAFDEGADGAAGGEGGAVLLLTTLERALDEGAFIHAVIRGSAVVHNGRHSATIATPSAASQSAVIRQAWRKAGLDLGTAGYVEAHGSGTRLGDAIEVEGLSLARSGAERDLPVGSVKTNLGHLDHAAGIAGLVKTILSVRHAELYPTLHFTRPAEDVDLRGARLDVVTSLRQWDAEVRRAGVSSFSLGGVNAHCVVEQPPAPAAPRRGHGGAPSVEEPQLIGVSARDAAGVDALCERLSLELRDAALPLADVALTLNEGREHHPYRLAVVAHRTPDLALKLAAQVTWRRLAAPDSGPPDPPRTPGGVPTEGPPRVIVLLSGDATGTPAGLGAPLPEELPLPHGPADRVRGQLAAHARLTGAGVPVDGLMSSGASRYAVRHLQGRLSAADTRALASAADGGDGTVLGGPLRADRLHAAVEEQLAAGPVVFVELAARGEISDQLSAHLSGRTDAAVVTLGETPDGVLDALGRLYEARVDLDWRALRPAPGGDERPARRVPLPGLPFRGVRCWARPLDDIIRFDGAAAAADGTAAPAGAVAAPAPAQAVPAVPERSAAAPLPVAPRPATPPAPRPAPKARATRPRATTRVLAPSPAAPQKRSEAAPEPAPQREAVLPWLRETLAELLYADEVPADADYFSIGGNSVIALQLIERVIARFGAALKLVDVYAHPRVADLAGAVGDRMPQAPARAPERKEAPDAAPAPDAHRLPPILPGREPVLSYGQERMWFHHQLDPATTLYNLPGASRMRGEPDLEALRLAWEDLARRHEVLRSNFAEADGRPQLVIRPGLGDFFRVLDVSGEPDPEQAARAAVQAETHWVFDVSRDSLVRVTVVRCGPGDYLFCWTMHHGVNDGWAPQILMGELLQFYEARCEGRVHRPEPLPVQYRDYAQWQRELLEGSLLDGELDYWRGRLSHPPALELPTDRPRPARMDYAGATYGFTVPGELVARLRAVGSRETATLFMVLLTGLNVLLSRWSGQRDVVVGTPTIGRSRPELWGLLGFFNNTIALRSDLSGDASFRELLRRVRAVVLGAMEHQEIPFDRVVREVAPDRDPSRNPIFDVMYVHQTLPPDFAFGESVFNPGRPGGEEDETPLFPGLPPGTAKFDLTVVVAERPDVDALEVAVEYSTRLFDAGTVAAMSASLLDLLRAAADDDGLSYGELPAGPPRLPEPADTAVPATAVPDTAVPDTAVPDTAVPDTAVPDTAPAPPSPPPPPAPLPVRDAATVCLRLRGEVDAEVLRAALGDLAERHATSGRPRPAPPARKLSPFARDGADGLLSTADVSGRAEPMAAAHELASAHGRRTAGPPTGPPLSALLVTTGAADHVLVVTAPREICDGARSGAFLDDLFAFCAARSGDPGAAPAVTAAPPLPAGAPEEALAHWRKKLTGLPPFELPADRPRPMRGTGASASHGFRIPSGLAEELVRAGARERLLAALATLLCLRSGTDEVVVGLTGAAGGPPVLRLDTSGRPGLETLAARVREETAAAPHGDVPLADAVRALRLPREPGRRTLCDVTYAHHRLPGGLGAGAGLDVGAVRWPGAGADRLTLPAGTGGHDLSWSVVEGPAPGALSVAVEYRTEMFDAATVQALADDLVALLRSGSREPAVPLCDLWLSGTSSYAG